jgi:hypothetical protein
VEKILTKSIPPSLNFCITSCARCLFMHFTPSNEVIPSNSPLHRVGFIHFRSGYHHLLCLPPTSVSNADLRQVETNSNTAASRVSTISQCLHNSCFLTWFAFVLSLLVRLSLCGARQLFFSFTLDSLAVSNHWANTLTVIFAFPYPSNMSAKSSLALEKPTPRTNDSLGLSVRLAPANVLDVKPKRERWCGAERLASYTITSRCLVARRMARAVYHFVKKVRYISHCSTSHILVSCPPCCW